MFVLVPQALIETEYRNSKYALKIVSRIVSENIKRCSDFRSKHKLKGRPTDPRNLQGNWINFHSYDLRSITSDYRKICANLERDGWIERNPHYSNFAGKKFPYSFRLQSKWWNAPLKLFSVKQRLNKKKFHCVVGSDGGEHNEEYLAAERFLGAFALPENKVDELDAVCDLSSWPDQQRYHIATMSAKSWWSKVDDYGRYHSPLTNLSKSVRKYLSCNGWGVVGFDFANFQPALLTRQKINEISDYENEKYYSLCSRGEIYEYMAEQCPRYESRDEAKTDFLSMLNKTNESMRKMELFKTFQVSFPRYADTVLKIKEDSHKEMTKFLQWHETQIMFGGIVRDFMTKSKSPFFTIHDSIYSANTEKQILKNVITKKIIDYDLPTRVREEECLTTTPLPINVSMKMNTNYQSTVI